MQRIQQKPAIKIKMKKSLIALICLAFSISSIGQDTIPQEPINSAQRILNDLQNRKVTLGAYAQVDYNQQLKDSIRHNGKMDVHRAVIFMGMKFNDKVHFVSEIEFEHVKELYVEQAFLNYNIVPALNFRAGLMLIPMGIINEYHEPTTFNGVERPTLDGNIVPTTWREIGAGFSGKIDNASLKYQVYVVNGFSSYDDGGKLRGSNGFRKGRQKGAESQFSSPNFSAKVDFYGINGLKMGAAAYIGKTQSSLFDGLKIDDTDAVKAADSSIVDLNMFGFDLRYKYKALTARAQVIYSTIGGSKEYNEFTGTDLGSEMFGYYAEAGYDVLSIFNKDTAKELNIFARYSQYDTHHSVEEPMIKNLSYNRTDITIGAGLKVHQGAVLKGDLQLFSDEASGRITNKQVNFGIGFWF